MADGKKPFRWVEDGGGRRHMETDMGHVFYRTEPTGERQGAFHTRGFRCTGPLPKGACEDPEVDYMENVRPLEAAYTAALERGVYMCSFGRELSPGDYDGCGLVCVGEAGFMFAVEKKYYEAVRAASSLSDGEGDGLWPSSALYDAVASGSAAVRVDGGSYAVAMDGQLRVVDGPFENSARIMSMPASAVRELSFSEDGRAFLWPLDQREASRGDPFIYRFREDDPLSRDDVATAPGEEMDKLFGEASASIRGELEAAAAYDAFPWDAPGDAYVTYGRSPYSFGSVDIRDITAEGAEELAGRAWMPELYIVRDGQGGESRYRLLSSAKDRLMAAYDEASGLFHGLRLSVDAKALSGLVGGDPERFAEGLRGAYDTVRSITGKELGGAGFEAWAKQKAQRALGGGPARYGGDDIPDIGYTGGDAFDKPFAV